MANRVARRLKGEAVGSGHEALYDTVNRAKHRWLKRVMYDPEAAPTEKNFAYLVTDHLNCVTLDCWPSQRRIADLFGCSTKTVHRMSFALKRHGYLRITRNTHGSYRYAPIFLPEEWDKSDAASRQSSPLELDKNVAESFLGNPSHQSSSNPPASGLTLSKYRSGQRGFYETGVAKRLGEEGFDILARFSEHDDTIVERLCRACADGELGDRELSAARLAAAQLPRRRLT
jgi:hypothetical protein